MLIVSLVLSAVMLVAMNVTAFSTRSILAALPACCLGLVGLGFCMFVLPALLLHSALTLAAGLLCAWLAPRPRVFLATTVTCFLLAYGSFGVWSWAKLEELRHQSAPETLAERLAYEDRPFRLPDRPKVGEDVRLISLRMEKPIDLEPWRFPPHSTGRAEALKKLHEDQVSAFVDSAGVGIGRAPRPIRYQVEFPEAPFVPLDEFPSSIPPESEASLLSGGAASLDTKTDRNLQSLHADSVSDFAFPEGFGYVKARERVFGFLPHRFTLRPRFDGAWRFRTLELVSLLKHAAPAVYVSDNLPRMSELRHAATRPLDAFEAAALPRLAKDDLVVHTTDE